MCLKILIVWGVAFLLLLLHLAYFSGGQELFAHVLSLIVQIFSPVVYALSSWALKKTSKKQTHNQTFIVMANDQH